MGILALSISRGVLAVYMAGCPVNVLDARPKMWLCVLATSLLIIQILIMLTQKLNPRIFPPKAEVRFQEVKTTPRGLELIEFKIPIPPFDD